MRFPIVVLCLLSAFLLIFPACETEEKVVKCSCENCDAQDDDSNSDGLEIPTWEWVSVAGTTCLDGTESGFGLRRVKDSKKLAVYMMAPGICAFEDQCSAELHHIDQEVFDRDVKPLLRQGLLNPYRDENPLRDYNYVFIPGCNGDMHAGNQPEGKMILGQETVHFTGFINLQKIVPFLQEEFDFELERIVLWGDCSGGNGTLVAYPLLADAFAETPVTLINDSGPLGAMDEAFSPCLQKMMRLIFNINPAIPAACADCTMDNGDGLANIQPYLAKAYPQGNFGLLAPLQDQAIRLAWGFGQDYCLGWLTAQDEYDILLAPELYTEALFDLRDNYLLPTGRWSTFFTEGEFHTFSLMTDLIFDFQAAGYPLLDFIGELVEGRVPEPIYFEEEIF